MTTELTKAAQQAIAAIDALLRNTRRNAHQLSGKVMGDAENASAELRRALTQRPAAQEVDESAWLIEQLPLHGSSTRYFTGRRDQTGRVEFSTDSLQAVRFARQEDAERMLTMLDLLDARVQRGPEWKPGQTIGMGRLILGKDCYRVTEHMWTAPQQATPASAPQSLLMRLAGIAAECSDPDTTDALDALIAATQQAAPDHFPDAKEMVQDQNTIKKVTPEPHLFIGACITDGRLHATVQRLESNGNVTLVATAEMDAASLHGHDCMAQMAPATPEPVPRSVFIAGNETAMCAFAARDLAERYVSNFGGATAAGMTVVELPVVGATPEPVGEAIKYQPGEWYEAKDRDDLEAFFRSRLPAIREAAREHGYAIGLHGSMRRDLDLIAAPWREGAADKDVLAHAIAMAACGITRDGPYQWEQKPLGRVATLLSCCWPRWFNEAGAGYIDLSIVDPSRPTATPEPVGEPVALWIDLKDGDTVQLGDRLLSGGKTWRTVDQESQLVGREYHAKYWWPMQRLATRPAPGVPEDVQRDAERYRAINTPEIEDFLAAVHNEALHQRERWGSDQDAGKADADWFWLLGYLAGKALHAQTDEKRLHHIITTAAACLNWHAARVGAWASMRLGIDPAAHALAAAQAKGGEHA